MMSDVTLSSASLGIGSMDAMALVLIAEYRIYEGDLDL